MLLLYNVSKWSRGLQKCSITNFSTSAKRLRWPTVIKPDPKIEKVKPVKLWKNMTIWDFAKALKKDLDFIDVVLKPLLKGKYDQSSGAIQDLQVLQKYLKNLKINYAVIDSPVRNNVNLEEEKKKKEIHLVADINSEGNEVKRPPIVTIMGHVDHGKTTLLDALRNSNVVASEFGGITQHIGAFCVSISPGNSVTFIDTPGHAAFSAMRNRGAEITDIVVLIVAADDGVMEQTVESIKMAQNAGVKILVAVNKIDKAPSENLSKIKHQLLEEGVQAEDLGGDVQVIPVSALKRQNLDKLIEALLLEAEIMALTGDPNGPFEGVIVESCIGKAGKLATVIVKRGTLRKKTILLAGQAMAKVRAMYNEDGIELSEATLSQPAQIIGWRDLPKAGDKVIEIGKEKVAKDIIKREKQGEMHNKFLKDYQVLQEKSVQAASDYHKRKTFISKLKQAGDVEGLKEVFLTKPKITVQNGPKLDLLIKGDVHGSIEAILNVINTYDCNELCELKVVHSGVGIVTESDIELAETFNATIYCFNLPFPENLKSEIVDKGIKIRFHNVIYKLVDDLRAEITSKVPPVEGHTDIGTAEVIQQFIITEKKSKIPTAGCMCISGELRKELFYKVLRNDTVLYDGQLKSMKHFKNEVNTIKKGSQCGIMFQNFNGEFKAGDKIICYEKHLDTPQITWNPGF